MIKQTDNQHARMTLETDRFMTRKGASRFLLERQSSIISSVFNDRRRARMIHG